MPPSEDSIRDAIAREEARIGREVPSFGAPARTKATRRGKGETGPTPFSKAQLDELVEQATVDCYNESGQVTGRYTMIEDNLALPFELPPRLEP